MPDKTKNPFNPSFGKLPPIYIDRSEQIGELVDEFHNPDSPYQTTLIYGQRGSGKTAFMVAVCDELRKDKNFIVVDIPSHDDILRTYVQCIYDQATKDVKKALDTIDSLSVSVLGVQVGYNKKDTEPNYLIVLQNMLKKLAEKNITVLAAIDEIELSTELKNFVSIYKILLQQNLPVRLMMAGLPQNVTAFQNSKGMTFLLRAARITLQPLNVPNIKFNYKKAFDKTGRKYEEDALTFMAKSTAGYAYAFQLIGYLAWKSKDEVVTLKTVKSLIDEYKTLLYRNAYGAICDALSEKDIAFIVAMAGQSTETVKMSAISEATGEPASYLSKYRLRLIDAQVIGQSKYGYVKFTLPFFKNYVQEFVVDEF